MGESLREGNVSEYRDVLVVLQPLVEVEFGQGQIFLEGNGDDIVQPPLVLIQVIDDLVQCGEDHKVLIISGYNALHLCLRLLGAQIPQLHYLLGYIVA